MDEVESGIRDILAQVLDVPAGVVATLPAATPLFGGDLDLSSLGGARLLALIHERYGVDVASEDWALESLASIGTLTDFVRGSAR